MEELVTHSSSLGTIGNLCSLHAFLNSLFRAKKVINC